MNRLLSVVRSPPGTDPRADGGRYRAGARRRGRQWRHPASGGDAGRPPTRLRDDPDGWPLLVLGPLFLRNRESAGPESTAAVEETGGGRPIGALPMLLFHLARDDAATDRWARASRSTTNRSGWPGRPARPPNSPHHWPASAGWRREWVLRNRPASAPGGVRQLCEAHQIHLFRAWTYYGLGDLELAVGSVDTGARLISRPWRRILTGPAFTTSTCRRTGAGGDVAPARSPGRRSRRRAWHIRSGQSPRASRGRWPGPSGPWRCVSPDEVTNGSPRPLACMPTPLTTSNGAKPCWRKDLGCAGQSQAGGGQAAAAAGIRDLRPARGAPPSPTWPPSNCAATGERPHPAGASMPSELTPQELQIADHAGRGSQHPRGRFGAVPEPEDSGVSTCGTSTRSWTCTPGRNWLADLPGEPGILAATPARTTSGAPYFSSTPPPRTDRPACRRS